MDGKQLKDMREKHGYSRKDLAKIIYVTEHEVQSWEEGWGITEPSSGEIEGLAEAFNVSEEELCDMLSIDISDGYWEDKPIRFIDYIDSGIRLMKHIKSKRK